VDRAPRHCPGGCFPTPPTVASDCDRVTGGTQRHHRCAPVSSLEALRWRTTIILRENFAAHSVTRQSGTEHNVDRLAHCRKTLNSGSTKICINMALLKPICNMHIPGAIITYHISDRIANSALRYNRSSFVNRLDLVDHRPYPVDR
jgi:hypothetical protein